MDASDDWNAVTSQIRMYAAQSNTRDFLVMDDCVGIYCCFPFDPNMNDEGHDFIFASTQLGTDYGDNPRLSLRELVVFARPEALERKNVELRDFPGDSPLATVGPNTRSYSNAFSTWRILRIQISVQRPAMRTGNTLGGAGDIRLHRTRLTDAFLGPPSRLNSNRTKHPYSDEPGGHRLILDSTIIHSTPALLI